LHDKAVQADESKTAAASMIQANSIHCSLCFLGN